MKKNNGTKGAAVKGSTNKAGAVDMSGIPADVRKRAAAEADPVKASKIIADYRRSQIAAKGAVPTGTSHAGQKGAPPPKADKGEKVDPKKAAKGKAAVAETKASTKRGNGVPSVNGIKFTAGLECLVVRDRSGIDGVTDARLVPTDVVKAKFVGYDSADGAYLFDDGRASRLVDPIFVHAGGKKDGSASAEETIFPVGKPKTARKSSDAINARLSLWYGREDYAKAGLIMRATSSKTDVFNPAVDAASAKDRAVMASAIGANPFKLFGGLAGDEDGQKDALRKAWRKAHKSHGDKMRETWGQAKAVREALVKRFGDAVKVSAADADRAAAEASAPKGRKGRAA